MTIILESDVQKVEELEDKMIRFYQEINDYSAFEETKVSNNEYQWLEIVKESKRKFPETKTIKILEIGAGRSGFKQFLQKNNITNFELICQDITAKNYDYLKENADEVFIGNIYDMTAQFHIIFHSYVFEHISRPKTFLNKIDSLLISGGIHCIQCPKYDFWLYNPNSLDHLSIIKRMAFKVKQLFNRSPFSIISDPAIFHLPFYKDRDAINLVYEKDVRKYYKEKMYDIHSWSVSSFGVRGWVLNNVLTCRLVICKK